VSCAADKLAQSAQTIDETRRLSALQMAAFIDPGRAG
jgi:hypothetical protein